MQTQVTTDKYQTRKANTARRNKAIRAMFNQLYNEKRIRYDDVLQKVADTFGLSPVTVERNILKS